MFFIFSGGSDRKVKIWEYGAFTGEIQCKGVLTGSNGSILNLDFDAAGTLVLAASSDFACRVWTIDDGRLRVCNLFHAIVACILVFYPAILLPKQMKKLHPNVNRFLFGC